MADVRASPHLRPGGACSQARLPSRGRGLAVGGRGRLSRVLQWGGRWEETAVTASPLTRFSTAVGTARPRLVKLPAPTLRAAEPGATRVWVRGRSLMGLSSERPGGPVAVPSPAERPADGPGLPLGISARAVAP